MPVLRSADPRPRVPDVWGPARSLETSGLSDEGFVVAGGWSGKRRQAIEALPLPGWYGERRKDLLALLDRVEERIAPLNKAVRKS